MNTAELLAQVDPDNYPSRSPAETETQVQKRMYAPDIKAGLDSRAQFANLVNIPEEEIAQSEKSRGRSEVINPTSQPVPVAGPGQNGFSNGAVFFQSPDNPAMESNGTSYNMILSNKTDPRVRKPMYDALIQEKRNKMLESLMNYSK